jgi:GTP-binding protein
LSLFSSNPIYNQAGDGGDGGIFFSSIFANEFAGPSGGNGGCGGHVIFRASSSVSSLGHVRFIDTKKHIYSDFSLIGKFSSRKTITAPDGVTGGENKMDGKNAQDLIVDVPVGTIFRNKEREIVAELVKEGSLMLAARVCISFINQGYVPL